MDLITRHIVPIEYSAGYCVETITFNRCASRCYVGVRTTDTTWLRDMGFIFEQSNEPRWRKFTEDGLELIVRVNSA